MSDNAKALLHYAHNWRDCDPHDSDRMYCFHCAARWAAHIIGAGC